MMDDRKLINISSLGASPDLAPRDPPHARTAVESHRRLQIDLETLRTEVAIGQGGGGQIDVARR